MADEAEVVNEQMVNKRGGSIVCLECGLQPRTLKMAMLMQARSIIIRPIFTFLVTLVAGKRVK